MEMKRTEESGFSPAAGPAAPGQLDRIVKTIFVANFVANFVDKAHDKARDKVSRARRAGFTLVEMLTVIAIISILIGVTGLSLVKARELGRRARADAELREMVTAWLQYQQLYEEWPAVVKGKIGIDVTDAVLDPLINPESADNSRGIVMLNLTLPRGSSFNDPWGTPYRLSFDRDTDSIKSITALRTSVTFPNRQRRFP